MNGPDPRVAPVLDGRELTEADNSNRPAVAVVNETFVRKT